MIVFSYLINNMQNLKITYLSLLLLFQLLLTPSRGQSLTVTPSSTTINAVSTYTFTATSFTTSSNNTITITLTSLLTINSGATTLVYNWNDALYATPTVSSSVITFVLASGDYSNTSFVFKLTYIKNPAYREYQTVNMLRGTTNSADAVVTYDKGTITGCSLTFGGVTGQQVSTATLAFTTANPISTGTVLFRINYGSVYNNSVNKIVDNNNITCSISVNNGTYTTATSASISTVTSYFDCTFSSLSLPSSASVVIKLNNVRNPPFKSNYFTDGFKVDSMDGNAKYYDIASSCTLNNVTVDSYVATLSLSNKLVNSLYTSPVVQTSLTVNKLFSQDTIILDQSTITFTTMGSLILFTRSTTNNQLIFYYQSNTSSTVTTYNTATDTNSDVDKIKLTMTGFVMKMPPSLTPVLMVFKFYRLGLQYMWINVSVQAIAAIFDTTDLVVSAQTNQIGYSTVYTFGVTISQPLGTSAKILIDLPLQLILTSFSSSTSTCTFTSSDSNTAPACSVSDYTNKILQILITSTAGIAAPQTLSIKIGDIGNPADPSKNYTFGIQTYYDSTTSTSKVQLGDSISVYAYTYRYMNILTDNLVYTVNYYPSSLTLTYTNGVSIPTSSVISFYFKNISDVTYKNTTLNSTLTVYSNSQSGLTINLVVSSTIYASSTVVFTFTFKAPANVAYFDILTVQVVYSTYMYQITQSALAINVGTPATQVFSILPGSSVTGATTGYTFGFYTNVQHPSTFYLLIIFPSDVTVNASTTITCSPVSVCTGISNQSNTSTTKVQLTVTKSSTSNSYSIYVYALVNPRKVGTTSPFAFQTMTTSSQQIISGSATTTMTTPNAISALFDTSKSYYRMNVQPVSITITVTNQLVVGDYVQIRFDYRTYTIVSTSSVVCSDGNTCTYDSTLSTTYTTIVKVVPYSYSSPLSISIQGLNSSSTTYYSQNFQITIRTYSYDNKLIDEGTLNYNISCRSSTVLINKVCRTCNQLLNTCVSCYSGYYLYNGACVTNCASSSTYSMYNTSSDCVSCINNCKTCISSTKCITCVSAFYLYENGSCISTCNTINGGQYTQININNDTMCIKCWSSACLKCTDGSSSSCTDCGTYYLNDGKCETTCNVSTHYVDTTTNACTLCSSKCVGCTGTTDSQCIACKSGYYNVSSVCVSTCPTNTVVLSDGTCGCSSQCSTCAIVYTHCLSCTNTSLLLYNYQCIQQCPDSSYKVALTCIDCVQGCLQCSTSSCSTCLNGYNMYQGNCYTECNSVGQRFAATNGKCVQCPSGCDLCDLQLKCSVCLSGYTLQNYKCVQTCTLDDSCQQQQVVPDKVLPVPGFIAAAIWTGVVVVLKVFFINKVYMPYAYIFIGCVIEYVLVIVSLYKMNATVMSILSVGRLLAAKKVKSYQYAVVGLLSASLGMNYLSNIGYLVIFWMYLKRYIPDRQIDKISNYLVITLSMLTNYRFSLLAYSKMFPKPNILVQNQSKLTPIHYLCVSSLFTAVLPLTAAGILIYNEYPLTDLFMLGVDLLIIVVLQYIFTIWMVSVNKPQEYFQTLKKYQNQDIHKTLQAINEKEESRAKLGMQIANQNSIVHVEDIQDNHYAHTHGNNQIFYQNNHKSDNQNQPLPSIPVRSNNINMDTLKIKPREENLGNYQNYQGISSEHQEPGKEGIMDKKTIRGNKNRMSQMQMHKSQTGDVNKIVNQAQLDVRKRNKEVVKNFSKEKRVSNNKDNVQIVTTPLKTNQKQKQEEISQSDFQAQMRAPSQSESNQMSMKPSYSQIQKRDKKVLKPSQRSSSIFPTTMMNKKQSFGVFDSSDKASSQIDQIDFESLIQTRMVDKSKQNGKNKTKSVNNQVHYQEISPSWFNEQNQRFDVEDNSDV